MRLRRSKKKMIWGIGASAVTRLVTPLERVGIQVPVDLSIGGFVVVWVIGRVSFYGLRLGVVRRHSIEAGVSRTPRDATDSLAYPAATFLE